MEISAFAQLNQMTLGQDAAASQRARADLRIHEAADVGEVRAAFQQFVGETFYGQLLKQMRSSVPESEYFNGGNAEKIFRQQLDQEIAARMAESSAERLSDPMFHLFSIRRT